MGWYGPSSPPSPPKRGGVPGPQEKQVGGYPCLKPGTFFASNLRGGDTMRQATMYGRELREAEYAGWGKSIGGEPPAGFRGGGWGQVGVIEKGFAVPNGCLLARKVGSSRWFPVLFPLQAVFGAFSVGRPKRVAGQDGQASFPLESAISVPM